MLCPRCGNENELDISKNPCSSCGWQARLPHHRGEANLAQTRLAKQPGVMPPVSQQAGDMVQMNRMVKAASEAGVKAPKEGMDVAFPSRPATQQSGMPVSSFNFGPVSAPGFSHLSGTSFSTQGREKQMGADGSARIDSQSSPGRTPSMPLTERASARNIPSRPQTPVPASPVTPVPGTAIGRQATPFRPSRLVTEKEGTATRSSQNVFSGPPTQPGISGPLKDQRAL